MEKFAAPRSSEKLKHKIESITQLKAALFGAFLASLAPQHTEAMDFSVGTDWVSGTAAMEYAAHEERNEFAGLYVKVAGQEGSWHNPTDGDQDSVGVNFGTHEITILNQLVLEPGASHVTVCIAHTHPNEAADGYLYGPSGADIRVATHLNTAIQEDIATSLNITIDMHDIVFEKYGVWYYSTTTEAREHADKSDEMVTRLEQNFTDTIEDSGHTQEQLNTRMNEVRLGLLMKHGIRSRFVSYDDFNIEPPCAGVEYKK